MEILNWLSSWWPFVSKRRYNAAMKQLGIAYRDNITAYRENSELEQSLRNAESALRHAGEELKQLTTAKSDSRKHHIKEINANENRKATEVKFKAVKDHLRLFRVAAGAHCDRLTAIMAGESTKLSQKHFDMLTEDVEALKRMGAVNVDGKTIIELRAQWREEVEPHVTSVAAEEEAKAMESVETPEMAPVAKDPKKVTDISEAAKKLR